RLSERIESWTPSDNCENRRRSGSRTYIRSSSDRCWGKLSDYRFNCGIDLYDFLLQQSRFSSEHCGDFQRILLNGRHGLAECGINTSWYCGYRVNLRYSGGCERSNL